MNRLKTILSFLIFISVCVFGFQIIDRSIENQRFKQDYSELNHFKYGLFSVDAWKDQLTGIILEEIDALSLTGDSRQTLKEHLEIQLGILIDKVAARIKKNNEKTTKGWFKQKFMDEFIDIEDIKKGIPEYASAMMKELTSQKTEGQIKSMLKAKIDDYLNSTFDTRDATKKDQIVANFEVQNEEVAKDKITDIIARNHKIVLQYSAILIILAVILFMMEGFSKGPLPQSQYLLLTMTLLVLLGVGVTTPMIDMEAKISEFSFILLGRKILFENQVLYFQSKSIIDVFWLMIKHPEIQMKLVGVLMVGFSIVFPVLKMLSSLAYYYNYCQARKYRLINFFVLKSGKWSMADVLVVAIFMSYIGFNGIINSQLKSMKEVSGVDLLTTNGTNLQPGFYIFLAYTLLAMFLASFLKSRECKDLSIKA